MAVISVKDRHTNNSEEFEKLKRSDFSLILDDAENIEEFTIELTIGDRWANDLSKEESIMYSIESNEIIIGANTSVVIEISETISIPNNVFGLIMPTGKILLEKGIFIASTKIEPSYQGRLKLLLFNSSKTKRILKKGLVIGSAIFFRTEKTIEYKKPKTNYTDIPTKNIGICGKIKNFIKQDPKFIITIIFSSVFSSVAATIIQLCFKK